METEGIQRRTLSILRVRGFLEEVAPGLGQLRENWRRHTREREQHTGADAGHTGHLAAATESHVP